MQECSACPSAACPPCCLPCPPGGLCKARCLSSCCSLPHDAACAAFARDQRPGQPTRPLPGCPDLNTRQKLCAARAGHNRPVVLITLCITPMAGPFPAMTPCHCPATPNVLRATAALAQQQSGWSRRTRQKAKNTGRHMAALHPACSRCARPMHLTLLLSRNSVLPCQPGAHV